MVSLQQQLDTYKATLDEKQQKNEQLQNKLTKVLSACCEYCDHCSVFRLRGVVGMLLHKRKWNLLAFVRPIKRR